MSRILITNTSAFPKKLKIMQKCSKQHVLKCNYVITCMHFVQMAVLQYTNFKRFSLVALGIWGSNHVVDNFEN